MKLFLMKKSYKLYLIVYIFTFLWPVFVLAEPTIDLSEKNILQGEPLLVWVSGLNRDENIEKAYVSGYKLYFNDYLGKKVAIWGVSLESSVGEKKISIILSSGKEIDSTFNILKRQKEEAPLSIPEKLGGNSKSSAQKLVNNLAIENQVISSVTNKVGTTSTYWATPFRAPLLSPTITDHFGYIRDTSGQKITHKGVDFHADKGTQVLSINRGIVRLAKKFKIYGNTVIVDHGSGVYSMYMHLSKISVNKGELVDVGQRIGLSGDSGYAESPHLHLSVRVNGNSIDPEKFINMFK